MLRRLIFGFVLGLMIGGALGFALLRLGQRGFSAGAGEVFAYLAAAAAGALTGTVAGKPIWAPGAKVEAGLKALFGGLLGVGGMFALRRWATGLELDLSGVGGGARAPVGELPLASLPIIGAVLGALFGLDNTDEPKADANPRKRVAAVLARTSSKSPIEEVDDGDDEPAARRTKR